MIEKISFLFDNISRFICDILNLDIYLHRVIENNTTKFVKTQAYLKFSDLYFDKMVFGDYINSLPNVKLDTIKKIAELTCSSTVSVYRWMSGDIEPPLLKKKIIAEYIGKSVEELFPKQY